MKVFNHTNDLLIIAPKRKDFTYKYLPTISYN